MFYTGMRVKVNNPEIFLSGDLLEEYNKNGYLYITNVTFEGYVLSAAYSGSTVAIRQNLLELIYDDNILNVLKQKKESYRMLGREIEQIEDFINQKCRGD